MLALYISHQPCLHYAYIREDAYLAQREISILSTYDLRQQQRVFCSEYE